MHGKRELNEQANMGLSIGNELLLRFTGCTVHVAYERAFKKSNVENNDD